MQLAVLGGSSLLGGGFFGKAAVFGASVGLSLLLKGKQKPQGKLNDLRVSSASYGRGIPGLWGTQRVTGNIFWSTDFREEKIYVTSKGKQKSGSKGSKKAKKGKAQPVFKYYANFAVGLAEGVIDDVLRIWADNNLIYDKLNPDNKDLVSVGFSTRDDTGGGKGAQKSAGGKKGNDGESGRFAFRFYPGTDTQMPDAYMAKLAAESAQKEDFGDGTVYCPAYRDLCYLMFENFALEDFGNRIPTITAEITKKSTRRPAVSQFELLPPPAGGWMLDYDSMHIDPTRNRLVGFGWVNEGGERRTVVRIFDIIKRKEIKRLYLTTTDYPFSSQTVPHKTGGKNMEVVFERAVSREDVAGFSEIGISHRGDLVFNTNFGNSNSAIAFMDSNTGKIISLWGGNNHWAPTGPDAGVFGPGKAFPFPYTPLPPMMSTDPTDYAPKPGTVVESVLSTWLWVFDDKYSLITTCKRQGARRSFITPGAPSTTNAMMSCSTDFGGVNTLYFYKNSVDEMPMTTATLDGIVGGGESTEDPNYTGSGNKEILFAQWPKSPLGVGSGGWLDLHYMSYVVGAEALCVIVKHIYGSMWAVKIDPVNGDILWEYEIDADMSYPYNTLFETPPYSNTNVISWARGNYHCRIDFRSETVDIFRITTNYMPTVDRGDYYWSEKDGYIYLTKDEDGYRTPVIAYMDRKIQTGASLAEICTDVSLRCDIPIDRIDTTGLIQSDKVLGYMYEQPTEARGILEELADLFMFDAVETDGKLKFKTRGGTSIRTIQQKDLGVVSSDFGGDNEFYSDTRINESELPKRGTITYFNPKKDYEQATQIFSRPSQPLPVLSTNEAVEVTANMALTSGVARSLITRVVYAAWSERTQRQIMLPRDHLDLDPTDVITIELEDGELFSGRITDITLGNNFEMEVAMVSQTPAAYTYTIDADDTRGVVYQPSSSYPVAIPLIFNVPYLDDGDADDGAELVYYWGAGAYASGFKFGVLQGKLGDTDMRVEGSTSKDLLWGYVKDSVPPPTIWNGEDTETVIELIPAFDFNENGVVYDWESISDADWPNVGNMIIIGDEVILFKNVEETAEGTIKISRLIRGYRGSIEAAYKHKGNPDSSYWALVIGEEMQTSTDPFNTVNKVQSYNVHTGNVYAALTMTTSETLNGATRRPLPVGGVKRTTLADGIKVDWKRATRYNGELKDGTGTIPLNEEDERYYVYLLKAPYDPLTWNSSSPDPDLYFAVAADLTTPTLTYTSAALATHGLTKTSDIHVVIYQCSVIVGLGFPHGLTLSYSLFGE